MWKFIGGISLGVVLALGYVRFDLPLPEFLQLPGMVKGNIISSVTEAELYDLSADARTRQRALEVYFANQAQAAAGVDAAAGHPFLQALHRARAMREARQVLAARSGFDSVLAQPALRATLERRHRTADDAALKIALLAEQVDERPFLKAWLAAGGAAADLDAQLAETAWQ